MRFYFLILISIFIISVIAVLTVNSITGNIPVLSECGQGCTLASYDSPEEKARVYNRWINAGFTPAFEATAPGFHNEAETAVCMCPAN